MYSQQHKFASYGYKNPENIKQNKTRLYEGNYLAYTKVDNFLSCMHGNWLRTWRQQLHKMPTVHPDILTDEAYQVSW